ncbi:MAG: outer membrane lipoprotein carrier protein LolA, partial [Colwellia sp.]|nr:outer membrane lipoprotein carrier protein LolA [Colwellia sp.]
SFPSYSSLASSAIEGVTDAQPVVKLEPLKGTFSQIKNIKPLKRPFKSAGRFVYLPNKGLLWHTQKPVDSVKLFANNGVYQLNKQGLMQKEAQLDNDFFLALFAADEQKLSAFFNTEVLDDKTSVQTSCLALTPITNTMQSLFEKIILCVNEINSGTKIPTKIELIEAKGNNTEILLQLSSDKVSPEEFAYFE